MKNDVLAKEYMSVNERFADAVNVGIFQGKQIVFPEQLQEIDTASNIVLRDKKKERKDVGQQYRDVVKKAVHHSNFCIIGLENQEDIHYVFPVRNMLYDAVSYKKQWRQIQKQHRKKKDLKAGEFLSGFSKQDSLKAVITLVVYYGTEPWDGARDIHSLIDWTDVPEEMKKAVPNYSIYLLELNKYAKLEDFHSDLKTVCRFLQNSDDEGKLEKMLREHREEFEHLDEDTYDLIGALGSMEQVEKMKKQYKRDEGGYDMCKGMEDWLNRKMEEGVEIGIKALIETCRELGVSREETSAKLEAKFTLQKASAEGYLVKYWG